MPFLNLYKKVKAHNLKFISCEKYGNHCDDSIKVKTYIIVINNSVYKYVRQSPSEMFIKTWTPACFKFYSVVIEINICLW